MDQCQSYQPITQDQIAALIAQGSTAADWQRLLVADGFNPARVRNTHFAGDVLIGSQQNHIPLTGNPAAPTGIYNASIHNCTIGSEVYIDRASIANYDIADDIVIDNVALMAVQSQTSFGNGIESAVINEAGGREVMICDRLSAQLAYVMALYRDRTELIEKIRAIIADYAESVRSSRGTVGTGARVVGCRSLVNVKIGPYAVLKGVSKLENGSINSSSGAPSFVGTDVIAADFILSTGSTLDTAANITRCFVGQGAEIAAGFTAVDSLFFANSCLRGGEAVSVFAGPFTVSHHKSSLLIAAMYSFFNAGSGLNQSNHMYKLGPVHQGIVERGAKTASDAYILWPARVGAFSFVKGRHYANFDTSEMPFSYILEGQNASVLVPAVNLRNVGPTRDSQKWPTRDKRQEGDKLDAITFPMLTPYTAGKIIAALDTLKTLKDGEDDIQYDYNGAVIDKSAIDHGIRLYQMAIDCYIGSVVARHLDGQNIESIKDLAQLFEDPAEFGKGKWIDAAGLIAPQQAIDTVLANIENGNLRAVDSINEAFTDILDSYAQFEWSWTLSLIEDKLRDQEADFSLDFVIDLISNWSDSAEKLDTMRLTDAEREFDEAMQTGYGIDGQKTQKKADFKAVRKTPDQNNFIQKLKQKQSKNKKQAKNLLEKLKNIT